MASFPTTTMIATHRQTPSISYPVPNDQPIAPRGRSPASPPRTPPHRHRPSLSNPKTWLGRASSAGPNNTTHTVVSKPIYISEPKLAGSAEMLNPPRWGALGTGATVVRTPQDALSGTGVQMTHDGEVVKEAGQNFGEVDEENRFTDGDGGHVLHFPSPPHSPSLPPVPLSKSLPGLLMKKEAPLPIPQPLRVPPAPPSPASSTSTFNSRPSLKSRSPPDSEYAPTVPTLPTSVNGSSPRENLRPLPKSRSPSSSEYSSPVLAASANIAICPIQPPFEAILISSIPTIPIDSSKMIISLETSTATYRTTFKTLTSRPSYLSKFISSLVPDPPTPMEDDLDSSSTYSSPVSNVDNAFNSIFHNHLTAAGMLSQTSTHVHLFLDRPSASYPHILAYLRSLPNILDSLPALPRALQLLSPSSSLETLLELRDEARYLGLEELYKLCVNEISLQSQSASEQHAMAGSGTSAHPSGTATGGASTMEPVREVPEDDQNASTSESRETPVITRSEEGHIRSPSAPILGVTRTGSLNQRAKENFGSARLRTPHAGWI